MKLRNYNATLCPTMQHKIFKLCYRNLPIFSLSFDLTEYVQIFNVFCYTTFYFYRLFLLYLFILAFSVIKAHVDLFLMSNNVYFIFSKNTWRDGAKLERKVNHMTCCNFLARFVCLDITSVSYLLQWPKNALLLILKSFPRIYRMIN